MILKGAVLIPGIPDKSGDVLDEETIRKAALLISRNGILVDIQHKLGNIVKLIRDKKNHLIFPEDLQKEGHKKGLHTVIHNHPKGTSPLASPEDIRSYAEYRIKYGISTNDKGTFRVKNNNGEAMSEKQLDSIEEKKYLISKKKCLMIFTII